MRTHPDHRRWFLIVAVAGFVGVGLLCAVTLTAHATAIRPAVSNTPIPTPSATELPTSVADGRTVTRAPAQSDTTHRESSQDAYDLPDSLRTTVLGTVVEIESHVERDGGLFLRLDIGEKNLFEIALGSLHTRPPPSKERLELHKTVRELKAGDRVKATGYMLEDGFWLTGIRRIFSD